MPGGIMRFMPTMCFMIFIRAHTGHRLSARGRSLAGKSAHEAVAAAVQDSDW
jgi:F0F1-type ATP synthase assembly protein I